MDILNFNGFNIHYYYHSFLKKMIYWFIFGCAGSSLLHGLFSSCGERGLLSSVLASHCHGFSCCRPQILGRMSFSSYGSWAVETGSAATAHKFSCSMACGDFPRSGIKSMSPTLSGGFFTTQQPGKPYYSSRCSNCSGWPVGSASSHLLWAPD